MRALVCMVLVFLSFVLNAQAQYPYQASFSAAYNLYPNIPKGILEAVAWSNTRINPIDPNTSQSCIGLPNYVGVFGLVENGQAYFKENLLEISQLSGYTVNDIKQNPHIEILAYAKAFNVLL